MGGPKKRPLFQKTKNWGISKKKKWAQGGHIKKHIYFSINGHAHTEKHANMGKKSPTF